MNKKFIAKLLIFCLVFTMLPVSAFAADDTTAAANITYGLTLDTTTFELKVDESQGVSVTEFYYQIGTDTKKIGIADYELSLSTDSTGVVDVSGTRFTAKKVGTVTLTATATTTDKKNSATAEITVNVIEGEATTFTVTFEVDGGSNVEQQTVVKGKTVTKPTDPTKTGYTFGGWYTDQTFAEEFDFTAPINTNTTVYAKWIENPVEIKEVTVEFDMNDNTSTEAYATVKITNGTPDSAWPANPERTGYTFSGWNTAADGSGDTISNFDGINATTGTVKLYAQWSVKTGKEFTVSFDLNLPADRPTDTQAPAQPKDETIEENGVVDLPSLSMTGYKLTGWAIKGTDGNFTTVGTPGQQYKVTEKVTLYAVWEKATTYTVTFDLNAGEGGQAAPQPAAQIVVQGEYATKPETDPAMSGKVFLGWFKTATGGQAFDFAKSAITANTTLYAQWGEVAKDAKVTFNLNYDKAPALEPVAVAANGTITWPANPTREGYIFTGWFDAANGGNKFDTTKATFLESTTVYAQWQERYTITFDYDLGETVKPVVLKVNDENKIAELPINYTAEGQPIVKEGYFFDGWLVGSNKITNDYVFTGNTTVKANWTKIVITSVEASNADWVVSIDGTNIIVSGRTKADDPVMIFAKYNNNDGGMLFVVEYNETTKKFEATPVSSNDTITDNTLAVKGLLDKYTINIDEVFLPLETAVAAPVPEFDKLPEADPTEAAAMSAAAEAIAEYGSIGSLTATVDNVVRENGENLIIKAKGSTQTVTKAAIDAKKEELAKKPGINKEELETMIVPTWKIGFVAQTGKYNALRLTYDIQPQIKIVVTTQAIADSNDATALNEDNSVTVDTFNVEIVKKVEISLPLADGFITGIKDRIPGKQLVVLHDGDKSNPIKPEWFYDPGTSNKRGLTFWASSFSEYTVDGDFVSVASVNGTYYATLQDAVNAVEDGGKIIVLPEAKGEKATVSAAKTFTIERGEGTFAADFKIIIEAANGYTVTAPTNADGTGTYVVTGSERYSGGGGGGSSSNVTIAKNITGGTVSVSPSNPRSGQTVTINVKPSTGYVLDTLTVTDKNGEKVELTKVDDNKYTFVMPNGKVTITPSFKQTETTTDKTTTGLTFSDVKSDAWYAEYIAYVVEKGMMNGYEDGRFGPNDSTTRAQIVTVLYRLEGEPATSSASFRDVSGGQYYSNAVAWAANNGIVNGYETGKFGPSDNVTREQIAAILYRYAQYKEYDVTATGNINNFSDSANVSSWAVDALNWAIGEGLINGDNGALRPQGNATRAEIATLLTRFCENIAK